ncbi:MAG: GlmU family protein [Bacteroidales bacterium]|nr:GlmU family protein [Bacteroidales bacterium]
MNIILFDYIDNWENLLPLTYTRPISEIRVGILTIKEKWEKMFLASCSYLTKSYLQEKFKIKYSSENLYVNSLILPNNEIVNKLNDLKSNQVLISNETIIGFKSSAEIRQVNSDTIKGLEIIKLNIQISKISYPWDIFSLNEQEIENDYKLLTKNRTSSNLSNSNRIIGENIFVEEGAVSEFAIINAKDSFVYLAKDSEIMEGSVIRGSLALCEHSTIKMGAKIYGATTIGPHSKVGGELNNVVITGYSNKGHDGFLGNAVLGEWCNLGADTNNSNLKNNYAEVKVWNYKAEKFIKTGLQFCGLIMGDHSKSGINTMFNTGTVVGVNANIFGSGFPRNFVPSFSWGGAHGYTEYTVIKAFEVNQKVMERRNIEFDTIEQNILKEVFEMTNKYRK